MLSHLRLSQFALLSNFLLLGFSPVCESLKKNVACMSAGVCRCEFPNGMGIDLSPLSKTANFSAIEPPGNGNYKVYFTPCVNTQWNFGNETLNHCKDGVSLCFFHNATDVSYSSLGTIGEGKIVWARISDRPYLEYEHNKTKTHIDLVCSGSDTPATLKFDSIVSNPNNQVLLTLSSPMACMRDLYADEEGMSILTKLFLIVLVAFASYFIIGILVLKFIRGADGWEMVPNYEFWSSLPTKMKNGAVFLMNGCKNPPPYDSI